jgi:hypothetical protein
MLRTVKIGEAEYRAIKALADKRQQFLQYHLNEAVRVYLALNKQEEPQTKKERVA